MLFPLNRIETCHKNGRDYQKYDIESQVVYLYF